MCKSLEENLWKPFQVTVVSSWSPQRRLFLFHYCNCKSGLLKGSKDFRNFRKLEIMFLLNKLKPHRFKWRPLWLECLPVMFLLSTISILKFIRWLVNCPTISAALPLSDLSVGAEIVISALCNFAWMKDFNWSNLFKISLDVNLRASLVPAWIIKDFGCFQMIDSDDVVRRWQ